MTLDDDPASVRNGAGHRVEGVGSRPSLANPLPSTRLGAMVMVHRLADSSAYVSTVVVHS